MTTFKKAVENLRPQIEQIAKDEGYFEAWAKHGAPNLKEDNEARLAELRAQYWRMLETVVTIFSHMEKETVSKALFDVFYDIWWNEYHEWKTILQNRYSEDKEVA